MDTEQENPRVIVGRLHRERRKHSVALVEAPKRKLPHHHPKALRLALAHKMAQALGAGEFESQADLAAWLGFTPAYISQMLDLTLLPPWKQEEILGVGAAKSLRPDSTRTPHFFPVPYALFTRT